MDTARYNALMWDDGARLTVEEMDAGWHFCHDFDGLLVGPGMEGEQQCCTCHTVKTE